MPSKKQTNKTNQRLIRKTKRKVSRKKQLSQPTRQVKSEGLDVNFTYVPNTDEKDKSLIGSWIITKLNNDTGKFKGGAKVCSGRRDAPIETYNAVFDLIYNSPDILQRLINQFTIDINVPGNLNAHLKGHVRGMPDGMNVIAKPKCYTDSGGNRIIVIEIVEFDRTNFTVVGTTISHYTAHQGNDPARFQAIGFNANIGSSHVQTDNLGRANATFGTKWRMCATFDCNAAVDPSFDNVVFKLEKENIHVRNPHASAELQNCLLQHIDSITDFMCNEIDINHLTTDMAIREMLLDKLADVCIDIRSDKGKKRVDPNTSGRRHHGNYPPSRYSGNNNWTLHEV